MLRLALPTGDLRAPVAAALHAANLGCEEYAAGSRALRLTLPGGDAVIRVFREKDIPIQVALGNYDLGVCSAAWVLELQSRFRHEDVTLLRPLDFGRQRLVVAAAEDSFHRQRDGMIRIVSEYPNLAEWYARQMRFPHYLVLPVWGAAEAYPPEDADLALLALAHEQALPAAGLVPVATILDAPAWLIAGRQALARRDMGALLGRLLALPGGGGAAAPRVQANETAMPSCVATIVDGRARQTVRLALPDGHAQRHTAAALARVGLMFEGYGESQATRRPTSGIDGLEIKVIRPQDMPAQVALGNFDLAVTGRDWLLDHRSQFPYSPVVEAVDLGLSRYSIAAAISEDVPADTLADALTYWRSRGTTTIRVASEYPNIADHFARARHLGRYQIVPVNGASEAFVPEDAEILIEGSETGSSFRANRLKAVDRVFESTNCVIAHATPPLGARGALVARLIAQLRAVQV